MKKVLKCLLMMILTLAMVSCSSSEEKSKSKKSTLQNVDVEKFSQLVKKGNGTILDVRTPEEVQSGKIESAVNINFFDRSFKEQANELDKTKPVYVYCASGGRSGRAMKILGNLGFKEVYNLNGGMGAWKGKGYATK